MKRSTLLCATAIAMTLSAAAFATTEQRRPKHIDWAFNGPFGHVDERSAQRGFQVYKEVCSACHALSHVAFRNLENIGFSEAEVKALAASYQIQDGPNDQGEMFNRPGKPSDHFPPPFPNEQAARAAMNGAYPPDLSLVIKARHDGPDYVYSILTGFETPPADFKMSPGMNYNPYFPGHQIAMPPPLSDGRVQYMDGTPSSLDQEARDAVNFLQWAAEPEMEHRKQMGIKAVLFLLALTIFTALAKKRIWSRLKK